MKKLLLLIAGIFACISLSAQTAEEYLDKVIEKMKSYNDISIMFNVRVTDENNHSTTSSGYASIKGDSYIINLDAEEVICNGKTRWNYIIPDEEVTVSDATDGFSPISIIETFKENTTMSFIENNDENTKKIEIKENKDDLFEKIQITIDKDLKINRVYIFMADGYKLFYEITDFKTNQNLPDNMFIFNEAIHPNVEVIDMR